MVQATLKNGFIVNESYFPAKSPFSGNTRKSFCSLAVPLFGRAANISVNRTGLDSSRGIHCIGKACLDASALGKTSRRKMKIQRSWFVAARMPVFV